MFKPLKPGHLTAVVFVVIMLAGLLWNHWSFLVLVYQLFTLAAGLNIKNLLGLIDPEYKAITPLNGTGS